MKPLSEYIEDMLCYKESLGFSRGSYEYHVGHFCRFIESKGLDVSGLKEEVVLEWCSRRGSEAPSSTRRRMQSVRELLKYLFAIGIGCYVIPSGSLPKRGAHTPYIFTDNELLGIFAVCDSLQPIPSSPHRHLILPILLRLLFYCGLRPNEGRELQADDIDFDKGIMLIRKNKSHKERYVAMSDDVLQMCKRYHSTMAAFADNTYFFPSPDGAPFGHRWLARQFRMVWQKARADGNVASAVAYDLRHRYATTMMMRWMDEDADLYAKLPYLSAYMGHASFSDTAYYIHLLPENLIRSTAADWGRFAGLIPEVAEDE